MGAKFIQSSQKIRPHVWSLTLVNAAAVLSAIFCLNAGFDPGFQSKSSESAHTRDLNADDLKTAAHQGAPNALFQRRETMPTDSAAIKTQSVTTASGTLGLLPLAVFVVGYLIGGGAFR